jgi:NAD(P)-dependent dehydrogenase (short-subunit alcohol dehydrogenase family)
VEIAHEARSFARRDRHWRRLGLGEATARMLASHGVRVAVLDVGAERGEAVAHEIGGVFCRADVTDEASVDAALARARSAHGVERIWVNCAGIVHGGRTVRRDRETGELRAHDVGSFREVIEVNLVGTFSMIVKCAAAMAAEPPLSEDDERGVVISTSSVAATDGQIGQAAYSASKAGVLGLTLPLARDLMDFGIRVAPSSRAFFGRPCSSRSRRNTVMRSPRACLSRSDWEPRPNTPASSASSAKTAMSTARRSGSTALSAFRPSEIRSSA